MTPPKHEALLKYTAIGGRRAVIEVFGVPTPVLIFEYDSSLYNVPRQSSGNDEQAKTSDQADAG